MPEDMWFTFFNASSKNFKEWFSSFIMVPAEEHTAIINAIVVEYRLSNHPLTQVLQGERFQGWMRLRRLEFMTSRRLRLADVKGDLEAVAFHPNRIMDWAVDTVERTEILEYFKHTPSVKESLRNVLEAHEQA